MKYLNCNRIWSSVHRVFVFTSIIALIALCCGIVGAVASESGKETPPIVAKCKADLAKRLNMEAKMIEVVEVKDTTWPDAALGMPQMGKMYAQVLTPGYRVILQAKGSQYLYTTSAKACKYGGPVPIWSYSMLYTVPVADEPDLNGDLYQCSLMGTNCIRIASGVDGFYPQEKGVVIFTRRTSRSGYDLLYIKAGDANAKPLYSAFYIGNAAMNSAQDKWAGIVRPGLGTGENVVVAGVGSKGEKAQMLPLPDGVRPSGIAWAGESVMVLTKNGERMACFEISPKAEKPEWKEVGCHLYPGLPDYMLNKSESLEIDQIDESGKPAVEVAKVWFTGDRNVIAKISGLTLKGNDLLGPYAFIWGEKDSQPAAYTVSIATGEVIPSFSGEGRDIRPFRYAPQRSPMAVGK